MTLTVELQDLRLEARQRADQVNSGFVLDPELNSFINASMRELYDLLVSTYQDYYLSSADTSLVAGTDTYSLPSDFYKLRGIDLLINGSATNFVTLEQFNFGERSSVDSTIVLNYDSARRLQYIIQGSNVRFLPQPSSTDTYKMWYIPVSTTLVNDTDTFDGINGFEEYIVVDAAIKMVQKEESDVTVLFAQKQALTQRIMDMGEDRDAGSPKTVTDVDRGTQIWGNYRGY